MAILIPAAFLAGVIVAVSPCVLPVLPVVLAGSTASSSRRRPLAIVAGLVSVPCTGPVLGTLIPLVGAHRSHVDVVVLVLAFSFGLAVPLLAIAAGSRRAATSLRANGQTIRVVAGVVMAAMAVVLYKGWAENVQTALP